MKEYWSLPEATAVAVRNGSKGRVSCFSRLSLQLDDVVSLSMPEPLIC